MLKKSGLCHLQEAARACAVIKVLLWVLCMFPTGHVFACLMSGSKSYSLANCLDFRLSR